MISWGAADSIAGDARDGVTTLGTASKNQIAYGEYCQGQEDSGGYGDQHPTAKFWARSGESQKVRGEVWWKVCVGRLRMICGTWHEGRLASGEDGVVGMYRNSTHRGDWFIMQHGWGGWVEILGGAGRGSHFGTGVGGERGEFPRCAQDDGRRKEHRQDCLCHQTKRAGGTPALRSQRCC
jgi:hypothetical protein